MALLATPRLKRIDSVMKRTFVLTILLMLASLVASAQTTTTTSTTDAKTPAGMAPGSPAGSFALSGFDTISPFSQSLNFRLPLLQIGGRGSAGYTIMLPIQKKWRVEHSITDYNANCPPNTQCEVYDLEHTYTANDEWWDAVVPEYSPGVIQGRRSGSTDLTTCGLGAGNKVYARTMTRLTFTAADGTEYELRDQSTGGKPLTGQCPGSNNLSRGNIFVTTDGSAATFISDDEIVDYSGINGYPPFTPSGYFFLRDGTRYRIDGGRVSWIRDRNGNEIHYEYYVSLGGGVSGTKITDSLGRVVTITYATPTRRYDELSYKGFGGAARTIRVWYANLYDNKLRGANSEHSAEQEATYQELFPTIYTLSTEPSNTQDYNPEVVSAVELPDEQRRYEFFYNSYGELARVELPTGGAFEYDYQPGEGVNVIGDDYEIMRRVVERRIYKEGGTLEGRMTFGPCGGGSYQASPGNSCVQVYQKDTNNAILSSSRHTYHGNSGPKSYWFDPIFYSEWNEGKEYITEAMASDGTTVLRRTEQTWKQKATLPWWANFDPYLRGPEPANDPRLVKTITTLLDVTPNLVSMQSAIIPNTQPEQYGFDQYNNPTDVYEYDYGQGAPGALLRHTRTDYLTTNSVNNVDYTSPTVTATSIHLRGLPTQRSVFDVTGSVEKERARTTFEYDNYTQDTNHNAFPSYLPIGLNSDFTSTGTRFNTRGNVTATTNYLLDSTGSVTGSISSYAQYDVAGNVVKSIDGRGFATSIDYIDRFGAPNNEAQGNTAPTELGSQASFAFPTQVTNALNHISYTQYDYYTGKAVNTQDPNSVVTSIDYCSSTNFCDPLDRPKLVINDVNNLAGKSSTTFDYDDANRIVTSRSDLKIFGDGLLKSQNLYDGLGRTIQTRSYETATDYITTTQEYDALGRVKRSTNPYRAGDTVYWTTSSYDALRRVFKVTTPDGAEVNTYYDGARVLVKDQAGKERLSRTNALGQLKEVWEITPADDATEAITFPGRSEVVAGYLTKYDYDTLGNLITVTQRKGAAGTLQTRTFSYNSLSQLTSALNPESGTLSYEYDANGNLKKKTDARNIITNYDYDELNRVTSRTYQNDSDLTPDVHYKYDSQGLPTGAPAFNRGPSAGRLVAVLYGDVYSTYGNYLGYDALGRAERSIQKTNDGQTDQTYTFTNYDYDLAGNLTSQTYPSGKIVETKYDSAGRIAGVKKHGVDDYYAGAASDGQNRLQYSAHGALTGMKLGNGRWEHTTFNSRLQPIEIGLGTAQAGADLLKLEYGYGSTDNNGNVQNQTITIPGGPTLTQNYEYDALNRLKLAQENSGASWKQIYNYDRFGNRTFGAGTTIPTVQSGVADPTHNPNLNPATNRIADGQGYTYDDAGNLKTKPDLSMNYDAENRQVGTNNGQSFGVSNYVYDGDGRRVKKVTGTGNATTIFVYNAMGHLVAEYADTPTEPGSGGMSYFTADNLGTPRVITDADGAVKSRHDYMPFGEEIAYNLGGRNNTQKYVYGSGNLDSVRQKFTQKERDLETDLDYFGARYYSSAQGRFTSVDPENFQAMKDLSEPQSWNAYAYVNNNPLGRVDPDGKGFLEKVANFVRWGVWGEEEDVQAEELRRRRLLYVKSEASTTTGYVFVENTDGTTQALRIYSLSRDQVWNFSTQLMNGETSTVPRDVANNLINNISSPIIPPIGFGGTNNTNSNANTSGKTGHGKYGDPNKSIEQNLAGKGQLKDLRSNPNIRGVNIDDLIKRTLPQVEQMVKEGKVTGRVLKAIKKAFEGRNLGGGS